MIEVVGKMWDGVMRLTDAGEDQRYITLGAAHSLSDGIHWMSSREAAALLPIIQLHTNLGVDGHDQ